MSVSEDREDNTRSPARGPSAAPVADPARWAWRRSHLPPSCCPRSTRTGRSGTRPAPPSSGTRSPTAASSSCSPACGSSGTGTYSARPRSPRTAPSGSACSSGSRTRRPAHRPRPRLDPARVRHLQHLHADHERPGEPGGLRRLPHPRAHRDLPRHRQLHRRSTGGLSQFGGYLGIITALVAWYTSAAGVANGLERQDQASRRQAADLLASADRAHSSPPVRRDKSHVRPDPTGHSQFSAGRVGPMHVPDGPQLDLSAQVAKVKAKTRPWKSIIALILAIGAAAASGWAHSHFQQLPRR